MSPLTYICEQVAASLAIENACEVSREMGGVHPISLRRIRPLIISPRSQKSYLDTECLKGSDWK